MDTSTLISYRQARQALGLSARVLHWRVQRAGVQAYVDGRDRRRRLLDARELPKLVLIEPVKRRGDSAA